MSLKWMMFNLGSTLEPEGTLKASSDEVGVRCTLGTRTLSQLPGGMTYRCANHCSLRGQLVDVGF